MLEKGVSLGTSTNFLRSLIMTSAARLIRFSLVPQAIDASVAMVQGQTTIASATDDPLAGGPVH